MQTFSECGATVTFGKPASYSGQKRIAINLGGRAYCDLEIRAHFFEKGKYCVYSRSRKVAVTDAYSLRDLKARIVRGFDKATVDDAGVVVLGDYVIAYLNRGAA
jgi:hypothetical protein